MDRVKPVEALHIAGSLASVTGISLLALSSVTDKFGFSAILAYLMAASIFIGFLGIVVYYFRVHYPKIQAKLGNLATLSMCAVLIPLLLWGSFYFILILKALAEEEFIWVMGQLAS